MSGRGLRPVAFLIAMVGFGLRLETRWRGTGTALLAVAAVLAVLAFRHKTGAPFVPDDERG
jgi:high-affinity Fe2+/Pb2+ permease